jgi:antitoxin ParD1/3/4
MAAIERVTVALPEPIANLLREVVAAGEYATTSDVIRDALRLWSAHRGANDVDVVRLRAAWSAGMASGDDGPLDMASIINEAKAEAAKDELPRG